MGASTDLTLTPRPVYHADGRKSPDCYTVPPALRDELTAELGPFPLFQYWGPTASIASSEWIGRAAERVLRRERPELTLVYLPHLDYDLQRFGPDSPQAVEAARAVDAVAGRLIETARADGVERRRALGVRDHRGAPAGRRQPRAPARGLPRRLHAGRHGVPRSLDLARLRRRRPPGRARLRQGRRARSRRARPPGRPRGRRRGARRRGQEGGRPRPRALGRARPRRRSRTPGSPTTTGSTTSARPTSRARSRSTASRATTRPSSSSTRTTRA